MEERETVRDWVEEIIGVVSGIAIYAWANQHIIADYLSDYINI